MSRGGRGTGENPGGGCRGGAPRLPPQQSVHAARSRANARAVRSARWWGMWSSGSRERAPTARRRGDVGQKGDAGWLRRGTVGDYHCPASGSLGEVLLDCALQQQGGLRTPREVAAGGASLADIKLLRAQSGSQQRGTVSLQPRAAAIPVPPLQSCASAIQNPHSRNGRPGSLRGAAASGRQA